MASTETAATAPSVPEDATTRARDRWFRIVLVGLLLAVIGFTATLIGNDFYPCVPAAGSGIQPPLGACATFLSPWIGLVVLGAVFAVVGYRRIG